MQFSCRAVKLNVMGKGSTTHTRTHRHTLSSLLCADLSVKRVHTYIQSLPVGKKQYCGVDLSVSILVTTVPLTPTKCNKQVVSCRDCDAKLVYLWPQFPLFSSVTPECLCFLQSCVLTLSYSIVLRYSFFFMSDLFT